MLSSQMIGLLGVSIWETIYMVIISTVLAYAIGLPIGVVLNITSKDGICPNRAVNSVLGVIVNVFRSIPFLILLIWMLPVTQAIVGTMVGPTSVIVPLVVSAAPFVGRMVESSLNEIDKGVVEAAQSMGSSSWQIIYKVLIPESKPSLIIGAAISVTTILGYSAMAGIVGGGGLGAVAMNYGLYRYDDQIMFITIVIIVVIVQIFQEIDSGMEEIIVGVVGSLQFDVFQYRMENEYNVDISMSTLPYSFIRWIDNEEIDLKKLNLTSDTKKVQDTKGRYLLLFANQWSINWALEHNEGLLLSEFSKN